MNQPRRRVLVATKILTVALTATTGCTALNSASGTLSETSVPVVEVAPVAVVPAPAPTIEPTAVVEEPVAPLVDDSTQAAESPVAMPEPPSPPENSALAALRNELAGQGNLQKALQKKTYFRPLCDKDGYPLVGNVVAGKGPQVMASSFCAAVRSGNRQTPRT